MDRFKEVLARQKFNTQHSAEAHAAQAAAFKQTQPLTAYAPIEQPPPLGFSIAQIEQSNALITMNCFRTEIISTGVLGSLPIDAIHLYSDGVFRLHREEQGIYKQIPVFIQL